MANEMTGRVHLVHCGFDQFEPTLGSLAIQFFFFECIEHFQHMQGKCAADPMRPPATDGRRHIEQADDAMVSHVRTGTRDPVRFAIGMPADVERRPIAILSNENVFRARAFHYRSPKRPIREGIIACDSNIIIAGPISPR